MRKYAEKMERLSEGGRQRMREERKGGREGGREGGGEGGRGDKMGG